MYNVAIIGSGPAGYTAAIYTARANLNPVIIEGNLRGGQLMITTEVENFPGFPEGVQGPELMEKFRQQAEKFGTAFISGEVTKIDASSRPFKIWVNDSEMIEAKALIIATGASAQLLNIPSEKEYMGFGVSACATCDGFFFRGKEVMVIGGGDTAMEEAVFLSRFCTKVYVVHRRDKLRASKIMQEKALNNPKIEFIWDSVIEEILGIQENGIKKVTGARLKNVKTGTLTEKPIEGIFMAIGHKPNTGFLKGIIELDEKGYIILKDHSQTSLPGIFACGDVKDPRYRQAITAAGSGCMAALDVEHFLEETPV
jgi:thioredoxin reductase (NADPH)